MLQPLEWNSNDCLKKISAGENTLLQCTTDFHLPTSTFVCFRENCSGLLSVLLSMRWEVHETKGCIHLEPTLPVLDHALGTLKLPVPKAKPAPRVCTVLFPNCPPEEWPRDDYLQECTDRAWTEGLGYPRYAHEGYQSAGQSWGVRREERQTKDFRGQREILELWGI